MNHTGLLVSVRSACEAEAALAGGADLIDVKEPSRGPLGAADFGVIAEVVEAVRGRAPVSAALGEWRERAESQRSNPVRLPRDVAYAKWGLADIAPDLAETEGPRKALADIRRTPFGDLCVLVAYADHRRMRSPDPEWLADQAAALHFAAFLIDTGAKDDTTLLDWVEVSRLASIRSRLAAAGVPVTLAGSLDERAITTLLPLRPDWFAVRGAACTGGRKGIVCSDRVRRLRSLIGGDS